MRVPNELEGTEQPPASGDSTSANKASETTKDNAKGGGAQPPQPPAEPGPPSKERLIKVLGGKLTLDVYQHPIIGSPEAQHIAVEMVSYDCPHCRKMHATMQHALERYGDQVALLILIQPLDKECNRLVTDPAASHQGACTIARLAVGVGKLNPPAFASFHDFLMSGDKDKPPAMAKIIPKAYVVADRNRLRDMTQSEAVKKQIDGYVDLFEMLQKQHQGDKKFGLPVQILGDYMITGSVEKEEDVFKAWEEHLGVKPK
jgi:thioredoxin family protein